MFGCPSHFVILGKCIYLLNSHLVLYTVTKIQSNRSNVHLSVTSTEKYGQKKTLVQVFFLFI